MRRLLPVRRHTPCARFCLRIGSVPETLLYKEETPFYMLTGGTPKRERLRFAEAFRRAARIAGQSGWQLMEPNCGNAG